MRSGLLILLWITLLINPVTLLAEADFPGLKNAPLSTMTNKVDGLTSDDEFLLVTQAYQLNAEFEQSDQLRLNWQIAEGYYLYRHGFNFVLRDGDQIIASDAQIPIGKQKQDEYFGEVEVYYHGVDIILGSIPSSSNLSLTVTSQGCADAGLCYPPHSQYFQLDSKALSVIETAQTDAPPATTKTDSSNQSLIYMLLLAMLGGAILNLMPCVFPVLSLKVLSFANDKNHSQVLHGVIYSSGVVLSFIAVAAVLVSLQAAGEAIGWGFHLQSPWFVASLAYLFFVMGLSLSGYLELGASWMNVGGKMAQQSGYMGSFFTGVLATVVASPCTAPFMGTALGFAVTQSVPVALLVFAALGLGMALPVLILSCSPKLLNKIPKPGPWMEKLKEILAFPLYATAVWLCWVVGKQTGVNGMAALLLGSVLIALAIWFWRGKTLARSLAAVCAALALSLLTSPLLGPKTVAHADQHWQAYSPAALSSLRQQGKPVFLNITADWCITCLANEKVTLNTNEFKQTIEALGFTYLKGDWTNHDPQITQLLDEYGRNGIPLYLVFPAGNSNRAEILPQILTIGTVVAALEQASPLQ